MTDERHNSQKRKRMIAVLLIVVVMAGALITLAYAGSKAAGPQPTWYYPKLALSNGGSLNYTVEGYNSTGTVVSTCEVNYSDIIVNASITSYSSAVWTNVTELNATSWASMLFGPGASTCYGKDVIGTSFGVKCVDKFVKWSDGALLISFVGSESGVGYRLVAMGEGFGFNLTLVGGSVDGVAQLDVEPSGIDRERIMENPSSWVPTTTGGDSEVTYWLEQRGLVESGLFNFTKEAGIDFREQANGSKLFFFTAADLAQMERTARLVYDPALAIPSGNGTIDYRGVLGLAYYIKDTTGMEEETGLKYQVMKYY